MNSKNNLLIYQRYRTIWSSLKDYLDVASNLSIVASKDDTLVYMNKQTLSFL